VGKDEGSSGMPLYYEPTPQFWDLLESDRSVCNINIAVIDPHRLFGITNADNGHQERKHGDCDVSKHNE
jgi:hypothetical protein